MKTIFHKRCWNCGEDIFSNAPVDSEGIECAVCLKENAGDTFREIEVADIKKETL